MAFLEAGLRHTYTWPSGHRGTLGVAPRAIASRVLRIGSSIEETLLVLAGLTACAGVACGVVLPLVAFAKISALRRQVSDLELQLNRALNNGVLGSLRAPLAPVAPRVAPEPAAPPSPVAVVPSAVEPPRAAPPPESAAPPPPETAAVVAPVVAIPMATEIASPPPTPPAAPPAPEAAPTLEEKIALVWFTRIGAVALLLGLAYFFKYAVDNDWIGPWGRIGLGVLIGAGLLAFAERGKETTRPLWTQIALGVGLSFLFLSAYASSGFYHLVPVGAAFGAFALVAVLGGALAVHHRGEPILILSLAAALAAPVLLSTGQDRPAALFSYLFVVTTLSHLTAVRMGFRRAVWLAVVGVAALFAGWYEKYFDCSPAPEYSNLDVTRESLEGPYLHLAARIVPLVTVVAVTAQWIWVAGEARRRSAQVGGLGVLVAATLLAHAGFAALLYDLPLHLGGVLAVVALGSAVVLHREKRSELLILPLLASFAVLVFTVHSSGSNQVNAMLGLLGLWAAVYAGAFLRSRAGRVEELSGRMLGAVGGVGVGFLVLASILLDGRALAMAVVVVAVSIGFGVLGTAAKRSLVTALASGATLVFLVIHLPLRPDTSQWFLVISAGWALIYFAAAAFAILRRRDPANLGHLVVASVAGLGFAALALAHTRSSEAVLRASLLAVVGMLDLLLGNAILRGDPALRRRATVLLGQALGLFAAAAGLLFTGATVTVVWAAMGAVVVWLASEEKDSIWLSGGVLLFVVAMGRLLAIDFETADRLRHQFFETSGVEGQLAPRFLLNARTYGLAGVAASLFVAARSASRGSSPFFRASAFAFLAFAHLATLTLIVGEAATLIRVLPHAPPVPMDGEELAMFEADVNAVLHASLSRISMWTTLLMGLYASGLVGIGFGAKSRAHRYLGLGLFALTLAKLAVWDVWRLPRVLQIFVLMAVGGLLLGASFLYARFGKRLVSILRDGVAPLLLVLAGLGLCTEARAQVLSPDLTPYSWRRLIEGVSAPGYYRLEIDPDLYRRSQSGGQFSDLRIVGPGPGAAEVPWLLRPVPVGVAPVIHPVTLVDPVTLPDGSTRAVLDLGKPGLKHSEAVLNLDGDDFFRKTRVEVSPDEKDWALLAEGGVVYRARSAASFSEQLRVRYPPSDARYVRITLLAGGDKRPVVISGARSGYSIPASRPPTKRVRATLIEEKIDPKTKASVWTFDGGEPGVPFIRLALGVEGAQFERPATLTVSTAASYWVDLGSAVFYRVEGKGEGLESTELTFSESRKRYFKVEVQNGDSPPLHVTGGQLEYRTEELIFQATQPGEYALYTGAKKVAAPQYDLARVFARSPPSELKVATFGKMAPNSGAGPGENDPKKDALQLPISILLGVVFLGLAVWTMTLLRKRPPPS